MKIGIDCRMFSSNFTGIGRYVFELVKGITELNAKRKEPHEIVLFFNEPEFSQFEPGKHVRKVLVGAKHYSVKEQTRFLRVLNREKLDLMHFTHFNMPLMYFRPFIVTIHDMTLSLFPGKKLNRWYHRLAYNLIIKHAVKRAKRVLTVSDNTKKDIMEILGTEEEKIERIYIGVDEKFRFLDEVDTGGVKKKYGIDRQFLLYTGVWRSHKNLVRLIEAFSVLRERGVDFQLVITGKEDSCYPEVKNAVRAYGVEKEVLFVGLVPEEDLIMLYNLAFIYVFPSLYEGFGLPPLEAMACGTPVAASDRSCVPEVCGEGNAEFFDPYDAESIVESIEKIHKDADLQRRLVENGVKRAKGFSWDKTVERTFTIMNEYV